MSLFSDSDLKKSSKITKSIDQLESDCPSCGLYKQKNHPKIKVAGEGKKKILIVGDFTTIDDDETGTAFSGTVGEEFQTRLRFNNIVMHTDCWRINALRCMSDSLEPTQDQLIKCKPYLEKIIRELKPKLILLMGSFAVTSFYGEHFSDRDINIWRLKVIPDQQFKCYVIPLLNPSCLKEKDQNAKCLFERDLDFAIKQLNKPFFEAQKYSEYVQIIKNFNSVKTVLNEVLTKKKKIVYDYETSGLKPFKAGHKIASIGFAVSPTKAYSFPYQYNNFWTQQEEAEIKELWSKVLKENEVKKISFNSKFEDIWSNHFFGVRHPFHFDPCMANHILDNRSGANGLKFLTFVNFGEEPYDKHIEPFLKSKGEFNTVHKAPLNDLLLYNGLDCIFTAMLYDILIIDLVKQPGLLKAYNFFMEGNKEMGSLQIQGIGMNLPYYEDLTRELGTTINEIQNYLEKGREATAFEKQFGRPILLTSNQDLGKLFYEVLGKTPVYTSKKQYRTDKGTLEKLNLPFVTKLKEKKKYEKAKGTYVGQFFREINIDRMHPFFDLLTPVTFRSACIAGYEKVLVMRDFIEHPQGIPIKDIKAGDFVYCFDDNLNPAIKKVLWSGKTGHKEIIRVHYYVENCSFRSSFDCTPEHKIRISNGEYIEAASLGVNQELLSNILFQPKILFIERLNKTEDVYDIEVEDYHNFFVNEICVHNSQAPNFQNLPKRDKEIKKKIRKGIIPSPGCVFVETDFSGAEVITSAACHKDINFINYLKDKSTDMHRDVASDLLKLPPDMFENKTYNEDQKGKIKDIRFYAKNNWTFAQFYGDWFGSCAPIFWENVIEAGLTLPTGITCKEWLENLGITELGKVEGGSPTPGSFLEHCKEVENKMWNERFPQYTQWKKDIVKFYNDYGYIENYFGFRFSGLMTKNQCTNFPIQSASFHLLLWTLIQVQKFITKNKLRTRICGQIHDSIISDVPVDELSFYLKGVHGIVSSLKSKFTWLPVGMEIEAEISKTREDGGNFAEMKEVNPLKPVLWTD